MFDNFGNFFKKVVKQEPAEEFESKSAAKERLQLVLMQDRANVSADFLELMKKEIIDVVKKYIIVDEDAIDVRLTTQVNEDGTNGEPTLYANIPIVNIRNELKAERITDQLNFADLIEEQAKQESEKLENQENKQLFNMSDTARTVVIDDETLAKVESELVLTKEREAKIEEKKQRQEERQSKREGKRAATEPVNTVKEQDEKKPEEKQEEKVNKSEGKHAAPEKNDKNDSKPQSQGKRAKIEEPEKPVEKKPEEKKNDVAEDLKKSIENEIAELDDLEKELFKTANELEDSDEEDEDFVTFDELYEKAQKDDEAAKEKNKNNEG